MKNSIKILAASVCLFFSINVIQAQSEKSDKPIQISFRVEGVCNMCKNRIENAALIKGVKFAEWNKESQNLTVIYKPNKVEPLTIQESIATAGHDTIDAKASDEKYKSLPGCCAYRDGIEVH